MKKFVFISLIISLSFFSQPILADFELPTAVNNSGAEKIIERFTGLNFKAMQPAEPIGVDYGWDISGEVSLLKTKGIKQFGTKGDLPDYLIYPRALIVKGLLPTVDAEFSFMPYGMGVSAYGGGLKWAPLQRERFCAGIRGTFTYLRVTHVYHSHITGGHATVSYKLAPYFIPYMGLGFVLVHGKFDQSILETNATCSKTVGYAHTLLGFKLKFLGLNLAFQSDIIKYPSIALKLELL